MKSKPAAPASLCPARPNRNRLLAAVLALACGTSFCGAAFADDATAATGGVKSEPVSFVAPVPIKMVTPIHPPELAAQNLSGDVVIECLISASGEVKEAKLLSASHPAFGEAALTAIRQWVFKPGERDGKPAAIKVSVPISFQAPGEISLEAILKRAVFKEIAEPIVPAQQLAAWPMPKNLVQPNYPPSLQGSGKRGKAVVSLVIDKDGKVINPKLVKATFPEFELPALAAAARMEFPPQLDANKQGIYVSMDVQFDFRDDAKSKSAAKRRPVEPAVKAAEPAPK